MQIRFHFCKVAGYQFHFDHLVYVDAYIAPKRLFVFPLSLQRIGQYNLFVLTANLHMQTDRFMIRDVISMKDLWVCESGKKQQQQKTNHSRLI